MELDVDGDHLFVVAVVEKKVERARANEHLRGKSHTLKGEMPHHHFDLTREICFRITWEEAVTAAFG